MKSYRYKAFISYSHQDESWARWLQRALEKYRVPKRLVAKRGEFGVIPARLTPVFRDREDLSSAASVTDSVKSELAAAESLIVICSPAAVRSQWVGQEIGHFRSLGGNRRVFALIVDGDPRAGQLNERCFPEALTRGENGETFEPLAADARKWADGKRLAKLKLVAGILGIRLDELRRRDMQRRRRNQVFSTAAVVAVLLVTSILAVTAVTSRKAAEQRRTNTEDLLGYMLGDLKDLAPISGLEIVDTADQRQRMLAFEMGLSEVSGTELKGLAARLRDQGLAERERGNWEEAMDRFHRSRVALVELYQRTPDIGENLYELGQAEFWVGDVHWHRGELDRAEGSFARYGAIARRLINADPQNAEYVMELSYTFSNLGAIEGARQGSRNEIELKYAQSALQYNQIALVLEPDNQYYKGELSTSLAWLADAWLGSCDLGRAYSLRSENVAISREFYEDDPSDLAHIEDLAYALNGMAKVQAYIGLTEPSIAGFRESEHLLEELVASDPENMDHRWERLMKSERVAQILASTGKTEEAWTLYTDLVAAMDELARNENYMGIAQATEYGEFSSNMADLIYRRGNAELASEVLQTAIDDLAGLVRSNPDHREARNVLALAAYRFWSHTGEAPDSAIARLIDGYLDRYVDASSCADAGLAAKLAVMRGDKGLAMDYTSYLLGKGYYEPGFVRFCKQQGLCGP